MRIFISLNPPVSVMVQLAKVQSDLRAALSTLIHFPVRWVPQGQFHLTLQFLGETESNQVPCIEQCLQETINTMRLPLLYLSGIGCFPAFKQPRIIWMGIEASKGLLRVQEDLEKRLAKKFSDREQERFYPHLTLGRIRRYEKPAEDRFRLATLLESFSTDRLFWQPDSIYLMESLSTTEGVRYRCISEIR